MLTDVTKSFVVLIVHLWELHMKGIGWQCDANDTEQETAYTNALHHDYQIRCTTLQEFDAKMNLKLS